MSNSARLNKDTSQPASLQWPYIAIVLTPLLCLRGILLSQFGQAAQPGRIADFVTYWAAGHLFLTGQHPYSPSQILHLEHLINPLFARPQLMLCPPWTLPLFALAGGMSYHTAHLLWFVLSITLDGLSAIGLWAYFGGERSKLWIPLLIAATFLQMGASEAVGQITPLILASLTAFLLLAKKEHYFLAGLCLFGLGIKPHLLYLVFLAILIWIVRQRRWPVLAGALLISLVALAISALYNPYSLDYLHQSYPAAIATACGIGGLLRGIFGLQHAWLQYLPTVIGTLWFIWYTWRRRAQWSWQRDLPILTMVSIASAPYAWYHDFILILPAIIALAARGAYRSSTALVCYMAAQIIMLLAGSISLPWMFAAGLL